MHRGESGATRSRTPHDLRDPSLPPSNFISLSASISVGLGQQLAQTQVLQIGMLMSQAEFMKLKYQQMRVLQLIMMQFHMVTT